VESGLKRVHRELAKGNKGEAHRQETNRGSSTYIQISRMDVAQDNTKREIAESMHTPPQSNINIDHVLPLLDLCCEYVGDGAYSLAGLARYAGSKDSFGSYALYDDRLLDKLLATDGCLFSPGSVNPSPSDIVAESGERGLPERSGVNPAFMLKLLLWACELPRLGDCDTEIDGTDICGEWPGRGDNVFGDVRYGDPDLLIDSCLVRRLSRGSLSRGDN
jgi:hypothetical protein